MTTVQPGLDGTHDGAAIVRALIHGDRPGAEAAIRRCPMPSVIEFLAGLLAKVAVGNLDRFELRREIGWGGPDD